MLTVVCWKWKGWREDTYSARNVNALQRMVREHLHMPHRFVCVTGDPKFLDCEVVTPQELGIKFWHKDTVCYRKLAIFSERAKKLFGEKVLSIDLDCVILDDITPLVTDHELRVVRGYVCPFNTSMVLHKTGTLTNVWENFDIERSPKLLDKHRERIDHKFVGSDQAWLAYMVPKAAFWEARHGVYQYAWVQGRDVPDNARIVFFAGKVKPWMDDVRASNWDLYEAYMGAFAQC